MSEEQKHVMASGEHPLSDSRPPEAQPAKPSRSPLDDEGYDTAILSALLDA
jgi:hypothetical protein